MTVAKLRNPARLGEQHTQETKHPGKYDSKGDGIVRQEITDLSHKLIENAHC